MSVTTSLVAIAAAALTVHPAAALGPAALPDTCSPESPAISQEWSSQEIAELREAIRELAAILNRIAGDDPATGVDAPVRTMARSTPDSAAETPALASDWRQRAQELADALRAETASSAHGLSAILAQAGFRVTPAGTRNAGTAAASGHATAGSALAGANVASSSDPLAAAAGELQRNGNLTSAFHQRIAAPIDPGDEPSEPTAEAEAEPEPTDSGRRAETDGEASGDAPSRSDCEPGQQHGQAPNTGTAGEPPQDRTDTNAPNSPSDDTSDDTSDSADTGADTETDTATGTTDCAPIGEPEPADPGARDPQAGTISESDAPRAAWERQAEELAGLLATTTDPEAVELAERLAALGYNGPSDASSPEDDESGAAEAGDDARAGATSPGTATTDETNVDEAPDAAISSWERDAAALADALASADDPAVAALKQKLTAGGFGSPPEGSAETDSATDSADQTAEDATDAESDTDSASSGGTAGSRCTENAEDPQ